jgi:tetratricopeptide (TPR) repeat protein
MSLYVDHLKRVRLRSEEIVSSSHVISSGLSSVAIGASMLLFPVFSNAQGFGGMAGLRRAKEASLKRMLPASVNLNQKRIKVSAVGASSSIPQDLLTILRTKLVTSIQKDNRFIIDDRNPETLLNFSVTNFYVEPRTYAATSSTLACSFYTGKIEASYQAVEVGTEAPLDSENLQYAITEEGPKKNTGVLGGILHRTMGGCGTQAKATANEARDDLVDGIVTQMSQRAAPFEEIIEVPVPGGKLEPLSALAISQRWAKLLEEAEKADPLLKPEDDAYRHYLIGLANEALAYQDAKDAADLEKARREDVSSDKARQSMAQEEKDFTDAQAYLDKAAKAYKDAMQAKPNEKEFRSPDARMEEAVRLYATINRHKEEYEQAVLKKRKEREVAQRSTGASVDGSGGGSRSSVSGSPLDQIIGMCQDHIPDIGQLVRDHPSELHFDRGLTLKEELKVKKECGTDSKGILEAVKAQLPSKAPAKK